MKRYSPEHQDEISEDAQLDFSKDIARDKAVGIVAICATTLVIVGMVLLVKNLVFKKGVVANHDKVKPVAHSTISDPNSSSEAAKAAVERKSLTDLNKYLADKVRVVSAKTGTNQSVSPNEVQSRIESINTALNPWNWSIPASQLDSWRQGPYGGYIVTGSIVGLSADGQVVIITYNSAGQITSIVVIPNADMLNPVSTAGSQGSSSTTGVSGSTGSSSNSTTDTVQNSTSGTD